MKPIQTHFKGKRGLQGLMRLIPRVTGHLEVIQLNLGSFNESSELQIGATLSKKGPDYLSEYYFSRH